MSHRLDYYFRQRVSEAELDLGFSQLEQADRDLAADLGFTGVIANAVVSQHAPVPDLTVDISAPGAVIDQLGQRIFFSALQNVNVAQDDNGVSTGVSGAGKEKIVSVFAKFDRALSDPRVDGNSLTVFFRRDESFKFIVVQGAEASAGGAIPPPLRSDAILLADLTRSFGQTQVLNANLSIARRQDAFVASASPKSIRRGRTLEAVTDFLAFYNAHVNGTADRHPAAAVDYAGGGAWADGGTNPATTVEAQLDKLVADLTATSGAPKVGAAATAGSPNALAAGTVKSQLDALLAAVNAHINIASGAHAASATSYAGGGNWADGTTNPATTVEGQLDKIVSDLAATSGAPKVGAAATASAPNSLSAGTVRSQLDALLAFINAHINLASGAHAASAVTYAGGSNWADGTTNPSTTVEAQLDKIVSDLVAAAGAARIGAAASGNLPAGTVRSQLDSIDATAVRTNVANVFTANQTLAANLLADATGRDLGSAAARFDAFLRNVSATSSGSGTPAIQGFAPDTTTPAVRASGAPNGFTESEGLRASHDEFFFFLTEIWDYLRGWVFIPMHTGDVPDATELNAVTQRNIVKAWGSVQSNGTINSPHWNVASVTKNGTGLYQVTLDVSPGSISAVIVTVNSGALNADFSTHVFGPDGGDFEVDINSSGVLSDQAFMFVVLGA